MRNLKPLLVNISGMRYVGVTTACERVARCLTGMGFNTVTVTLKTGREVAEFENDVVLDRYKDVDIVLFDKHFNTESAARRNLNTDLWFDADMQPDISILMSPNVSDKDRHERYLKMGQAHYGTDNHHVISTGGRNGKLFAAGNIKALILKEMSRA